MQLPRFRRTRFAPSPTGLLHLGHVASALYVWGLARRTGADVYLRIENHDRGRSRPEYTEAILRDLAWLGFAWKNDLVSETAVPLDVLRTSEGPFTQSLREELYRSVVHGLEERGLVYGCSCSRREIEARVQRTGDAQEDAELFYPGTCRDRGLARGPGVGWRLRLPEEAITFRDLIVGERTQEPFRQCGDLLIRDRNGNWTYQLAVTVDDLWQDMDLVVRGQDLLESTGRQILLRRLLGGDAPPTFAHHPLVLDEEGRKLAKRTLATAIASRREAGESAEAVLGVVARALGWQQNERAVSLDECLERAARL